MMYFMLQKYGSFRIWEEDYEKETYTDINE